MNQSEINALAIAIAVAQGTPLATATNAVTLAFPIAPAPIGAAVTGTIVNNFGDGGQITITVHADGTRAVAVTKPSPQANAAQATA